jgi:hypothetical protein
MTSGCSPLASDRCGSASCPSISPMLTAEAAARTLSIRKNLVKCTVSAADGSREDLHQQLHTRLRLCNVALLQNNLLQ